MLPGIDLEEMLLAIGRLGLAAIIFAESGLFFGFFLPGDSAAHHGRRPGGGRAPMPSPSSSSSSSASSPPITGDAVGYTFGRRVGRRLYERPEFAVLQAQDHLLAAEEFYERHGGKTIVIARFMPFVRTFAPIVAGTAQMRYRRFAVFNFTGAFLWAVGLPLAGYALGEALGEELDRWLLIILVVVVLLSVLPTALHLARHNRKETGARIRSRGRQGAAKDADAPSGPVQIVDEPADPAGLGGGG